MVSELPSILQDIVKGRLARLPEIRQRISGVEVSALTPSNRSLFAALNHGRGGNRFIMECKSASPSLGLIRQGYRPGEIAKTYSQYAAAISVLCEPDRFNGDYDHLATVSASTHLPVLCKDFIIDECQIRAARYFGADAVLLMMSVLNDQQYAALSTLADSLGLDVLTEVINAEEVERAIKLGAKIFGINHRNLHDLSIDLSRSERLSALVPNEAVVVAESGINDAPTVRQLSHNCHGFLVGSALTSQPNIDLAVRELVFGANKVCGLSSVSAAQASYAAGAVYGGLIFEPSSPRNVSRETSNEIMSGELGLRYVGVSRSTKGYSRFIPEGLHAVQIHAPLQSSVNAEKELIASVRAELAENVQVWRAISMHHPHGPEFALELLTDVDKLVLDAHAGGSGQQFDWRLIPEELKKKSLLAGGINLLNLDHALEVGCTGLDLNSGLEYSADQARWAGMKDTAKISLAFNTIRAFKL